MSFRSYVVVTLNVEEGSQEKPGMIQEKLGMIHSLSHGHHWKHKEKRENFSGENDIKVMKSPHNDSLM